MRPGHEGQQGLPATVNRYLPGNPTAAQSLASERPCSHIPRNRKSHRTAPSAQENVRGRESLLTSAAHALQRRRVASPRPELVGQHASPEIPPLPRESSPPL